jgi:hypothetical protein
MTDTIFAGLSLADIQGDLYRNIVSLRVTEHLFDDLSDDPAAWAEATGLEINTKPITHASAIPIIHRPFEESKWDEAIDYPFKNWMRSRYSDGTFGVWYGSDVLDTTIYETAYHWRFTLLEDAGFTKPGIKVERRVHLVRCDAALIDLRSLVKANPMLVSATDYTLTHQVGARLHREGHPGLVTSSARCTGDVYAIMNPDVLSDPRAACYLTYTTTSTGIDVERTPGELLFSI